MYDAIAQALAGNLPDDVREELLVELEALDGSVRSKRILVYYFNDHRDRFQVPVKVSPLAEPAASDPLHPAQQEQRQDESPVRPRQVEETVPTQPQPSRAEIRRAQEQLRIIGFRPGPVDGVFGQRTSTALRQYQAEHGLSVTGMLDDLTQSSLALQAEKQRAEQERLAPRKPKVKRQRSNELKSGG